MGDKEMHLFCCLLTQRESGVWGKFFEEIQITEELQEKSYCYI